MQSPKLRSTSWIRPNLRCAVVLFSMLALLVTPSRAQQIPTNVTPEQAERILRERPDLAAQLQQRIGTSGLTPDQIRSRLRSGGFSENLLDPYLPGGQPSDSLPGTNVLDALRILGITSVSEADSLAPLFLSDSARRALVGDRLATDSTRLELFGLDVFRSRTTQFVPSLAGPVDPSYRLGPGDVLVLILTGDVELAHTLEVTREGFVVIPQVGQLFVNNLTLRQLDDLLYTRLGRVYSGVSRGENATTSFQATVARLRTIQVFVVGDVMRPGSYQISSAGTVLTSLYAAGGPSENGNFRRIEVRRAGVLVDSLDLYDYLLRGNSAHDIRLETGDVIFVPVRGARVAVTGKVTRPAIYELLPHETLRDLMAAAGGFEPGALQRRIQIARILPPAQREGNGRERVVIDLDERQFDGGTVPAFPMAPADSVTVFAVAERETRFVTVTGNVWTPGRVGRSDGMRLSEALRLAGGGKPDTYRGQISVSRLRADSTRLQLRAAFQGDDGAVAPDLVLEDDDEITVYSLTNFRPERYIVVTGAVRKPGRVPYRDGMTIRDAVLAAEGLTEGADLREAEVARLPGDRSNGVMARSIRTPLDSTYLVEREREGRYLGPPGLAAPAAGAPEFALEPYDNVLIFQQPEWELQRSVVLDGKVHFPGTYTLVSRTERLSDLLARAGGLNAEAYPAGVEFYRRQGNQGRIGIDLPQVLRDPTFRDNLALVTGDSIVIPAYTPVVRVVGAVNQPVAVAWTPGKNMEYYVNAAGGYSRLADAGRSFVTQPSGRVESVKRRFLFGDGLPKPMPGAVVLVPERDPADQRDILPIIGGIASILGSIVAVIAVSTR